MSSSDIAPMCIISGVKSSPSQSPVKKSEKPPRFGVKTDQEGELATVRKIVHVTLVKVNSRPRKLEESFNSCSQAAAVFNGSLKEQ